MNTRELKDAVTEKPVVKFFKTIESMTRYCNYRYGRKRASEMLDKPRYVKETWAGNLRSYGSLYWFHTKTGKVGFEQTKADEAYPPLTDADRANWGHSDGMIHRAHLPSISQEELAERQMEEMANYIHSGLDINTYFEDREAGYAY